MRRLALPLGRAAFLHRDRKGTTLAEYAVMLFLVLVVCALAFKVLGVSLEKKFSAAGKHVEGQGQAAPASTAAGAASAASSAQPRNEMGQDPTVAQQAEGNKDEGGLPLVARFALIALGVVGAAAAFFAISKGKPQSG